MGRGYYVNGLKSYEAGVGELGAIENRKKADRANRWERKSQEREVHIKNRTKRNNRSYLYDDDEDYEYDY